MCGHLGLPLTEPNNSTSLESYTMDGSLTPSLPAYLNPSRGPLHYHVHSMPGAGRVLPMVSTTYEVQSQTTQPRG